MTDMQAMSYDAADGVEQKDELTSGLLKAARTEFEQSIGMSHDGDLAHDRERALEYFRGVMNDVPVFGDRAKTVSTDVADNIEAVIPDIVEILTQEDVVEFDPVSEEDEAAARQETDYINHVFFEQNDGFDILFAAIKDACINKTGVFRWYWNEEEEREEESFAEITAEQHQYLEAEGWQLIGGAVTDHPELVFIIQDAKYERIDRNGHAVVQCIPCEHFAVSYDTVKLAESPYCVAQFTLRKQDLLDEGIPQDTVDKIGVETDDETLVERARDVTNSYDDGLQGGMGNMARVTILEHYIRYQGRIYRLLTDYQMTVALDVSEASHIQYSAICPFPMPHKFYGLSYADKLIEVQRVKTGMMRGQLDNLAFSLNQRNQVSEDEATEDTLDDLMNNTPGAPIRSRTGAAVKPSPNAGLNFDFAGGIEAADVMAERRTGIQRGQTGLNPDTLHDTASGALTMLTEAQKRTRLVAKVFAQTGIKDMFLGLHTLIREHATKADYVRLNGTWVTIDPTAMGNRKDMTIKIGVGSGGRLQEAKAMKEILSIQQELAKGQGGIDGPYMSGQAIYEAALAYASKVGAFGAEKYFPQPQPPQQGAEGPSPEEQKLMAEQKRDQDKLMLEKYKVDMNAQLEREKMERETELAIMNKRIEAQTRQNLPDFRPGGDLST